MRHTVVDEHASFATFVERCCALAVDERLAEYLQTMVVRCCRPRRAPDGVAIAGPMSYRRTALYCDERFELMALSWGPGAATPIHDHAGQECTFVVTGGRFVIDNYCVDRSGDAPRLEPTAIGVPLARGGMDRRSGIDDVHRVRTVEGGMTVHLYARPLETCVQYDEETGAPTLRRLRYDAVLPFEIAR